MTDPISSPDISGGLRAQFGLVVVAAGRGARAGLADGPKQYASLGSKTVINHTLKCFSSFFDSDRTAVVIHQDDHALLADALKPEGDAATQDNYLVVHGGATRQASVLEGLRALRALSHPPAYVFIHDAARPFVSETLIRSLIDRLCSVDGDVGVLPVAPIAETIKRLGANNSVERSVPRDRLALAQTPQAFPLKAIAEAHERAASSASDHPFTDDASLFEHAGLPVETVPGERRNIKLTYGEDFDIARAYMAETDPTSHIVDVRTGNGYDVHQFGPGDGVTLCGITIPFDKKLMGHSDADVALHALTDALLATCGAGDIGDHFPPSDDQWKGAASSVFLEHAAKIVGEAGGTILNVDVSLVAEAPKIAPHREDMCQNLADMLGIERSRCSVKATTNERMGFVGRQEGIAAIATASVFYDSAGAAKERVSDV